jgi:hypothetical protein
MPAEAIEPVTRQIEVDRHTCAGKVEIDAIMAASDTKDRRMTSLDDCGDACILAGNPGFAQILKITCNAARGLLVQAGPVHRRSMQPAPVVSLI